MQKGYGKIENHQLADDDLMQLSKLTFKETFKQLENSYSQLGRQVVKQGLKSSKIYFWCEKMETNKRIE